MSEEKKDKKKCKDFFEKISSVKDISEFFSILFKSKLVGGLKMTSKLSDFFSKHINHLKHKIKRMFISSIFLFLAILFFFIGTTLYLPKLFPVLSDGLNFVLVGGVFLFLALIYFAFSKME